MSSEEIKQLKLRQGQLKASCTRAENKLDSEAIYTMSVVELQERKAKVDATGTPFEMVQTQIELLEDAQEGHPYNTERLQKYCKNVSLKYCNIANWLRNVAATFMQ